MSFARVRGCLPLAGRHLQLVRVLLPRPPGTASRGGAVELRRSSLGRAGPTFATSGALAWSDFDRCGSRSSFRERMASSRGAPVAYLLWLLATFLKAHQPPAAQPTVWTLPQLGRRQRRACLMGWWDLTGLHPTGMQWQQASLGLGHAGLGLRSTAKHASAAYLPSLGNTSTAAQDLDTAFSAEDLRSSHDVRAALAVTPNNMTCL